MNIKNLAGAALNTFTPVKNVNGTERAIKSENTHERDADGQPFYQKQQKKKAKMSREQVERAITTLNAKHFMKDMNWTATLIDDNGFFYAEVKDPEGLIIRKMAEYDLWELLEAQATETPKGNLLKRTA